MEKRCIDEETLADFLEGRLAGQQFDETQAHLADCDQCLDMIKIGGGLIRGGESRNTCPVPEGVTREAVALVEGMIPEKGLSATEKVSNSFKIISSKVSRWFSHEFVGHAQLAPVRGEWQIVSDNVIQVTKKFRSFEAGIEIEKTGNNTATIRVSMVSGKTKHPGTRVTLVKGAREVSSEILSGAHVVFEAIPFGQYHLVFLKQGAAIGNYKFEIKETVNEF